MRKLIAIFSALCCCIAMQAQKVSIQCNLHGFPTTVQIKVSEAVGNKVVPRDTLTPNAKQSVVFKSDIKEPTLYILEFTTISKDALHFMALPGEKINVDIKYVQDKNYIDIEKVKGSENIETYKLFRQALANSNTTEEMEKNVAYVLNSHSDQLISAFLVTFFDQQFDEHATIYRNVYNSLSTKYPNDNFVRYIETKLKGSLVGMPAPEISMKDRDGNIRTLSSLKGNVVMIDFWASWCRPCRMENPNVVKLYHQYHDQGFEIFSVSMDNSREAWLKAIADDGLVWPNHVSDLKGWTSSGGRTYGITSIPATVLIDRDGNVIARNLRGQALADKLKEIFGTK
ncbi:MAG: redoxin domain-containing protein [Bacteroidales bacterium]|nr:redoxin domain-containing protein [Candidatus Colimorpha pelethequi]